MTSTIPVTYLSSSDDEDMPISGYKGRSRQIQSNISSNGDPHRGPQNNHHHATGNIDHAPYSTESNTTIQSQTGSPNPDITNNHNSSVINEDDRTYRESTSQETTTSPAENRKRRLDSLYTKPRKYKPKEPEIISVSSDEDEPTIPISLKEPTVTAPTPTMPGSFPVESGEEPKQDSRMEVDEELESDDDLMIIEPEAAASSNVHFKPTSFQNTPFNQPAPTPHVTDTFTAIKIKEQQLQQRFIQYTTDYRNTYMSLQSLDSELDGLGRMLQPVANSLNHLKQTLHESNHAPENKEKIQKAIFSKELELNKIRRSIEQRRTVRLANSTKIKSIEGSLGSIRISMAQLQAELDQHTNQNSYVQIQNPYQNQYQNPYTYQYQNPYNPYIQPNQAFLQSQGADTDQTDLQDLLDNIRSDEELAEGLEQTPPEFAINLMKHQRIGLAWLKRMEESKSKGGILADDMGLGKTVQTIALILANKPSEDNRTSLIIAPVSLLRQWSREIESKLLPTKALKIAVYHGMDKKSLATFQDMNSYDVLLTSYGTLSSEWKKHFKEAIQNLKGSEGGTSTIMPRFEDGGKSYVSPFFSKESNFFRIILDEAQNIKNKASITSKSVTYLKATYRLCLSGTPIQNNVDELYPILRFLKIRPYNNEQKFRMDISVPLKSSSDDYDDGSKSNSIKKLRALLKAILLRRMKTSLIDGKPIFTLPEKHVLADYVDMNSKEKEYYDSLESGIQKKARKLLNSKSRTTSILTLLLRLRQACCHWFLVEIGEMKAQQNKSEDDRNKPKDWRKMYSAVKGLDKDIINRIKRLDQKENKIKNEDKIEEIIENNETRLEEISGDNETKIEIKESPVDDSITEIQGGKELKSEPLVDLLSSVDDSGSDIEHDLKDEEDMLTCPICFNVLTSSESITIFPKCGHMICHSCIDIFFEDNSVDEDNGNAKVGACVECKKRVNQNELIDYEIFKKVHNEDYSYPQLTEFCRKYYDSSIPRDNELVTHLIEREGGFNISAKIQKAMELMSEIFEKYPGEKIIIFSQFTVLFDIMKIVLDEAGIEFLRYDGSMSLDAKNSTILKFYDPSLNIKVLLLSLRAGNTGLTLTCASHVIIMDPFWNPFVEEQAMDRAYRIGQEREVFVHRILISGTVESRIMDLQERKKELVESALDEKGMKSVSALGQRELGFLFGLNQLN